MLGRKVLTVRFVANASVALIMSAMSGVIIGLLIPVFVGGGKYVPQTSTQDIVVQTVVHVPADGPSTEDTTPAVPTAIGCK